MTPEERIKFFETEIKTLDERLFCQACELQTIKAELERETARYKAIIAEIEQRLSLLEKYRELACDELTDLRLEYGLPIPADVAV